MKRCLLVVVAWSCAATALPLESRTLTVGSRVRAAGPEIGHEAVVGTVVDLQSDQVLVRTGKGSQPVAIHFTPSTTFEVSGGRKSHAMSGAAFGAAIGAMPGFLLTFGDYNDPDPSPGTVAALGAVSGAAAGALIGLLHKTETWYLASPPGVTAGIVPVRGGVAFSVHVAWGKGHHQTR